MKYMIQLYFFMVYLCNIKMSAVSLRHKSKDRHYDIDGFISQLLASRKFDDLAEKLAEKAAYMIMHIDTAPATIQRATDDNEVNNSTERTQEMNQNQSYREYVTKFKKNQMKNVKLRKEFTGKINPQAVINTTISLSENLQLKYKYLKKNALEKRVKTSQNPLSKNETQEEPSKHNMTTGPADFKDLNNKTEEPISNQNVTEKNQNDTEKLSIDENKRSRDDTKDDDREKDPNRNSELNENCHSGTDGEINDSSNKPDHSLEGLSLGNELKVFREAQNSEPEDKGIVKQESSQMNNGMGEDKPSSLDEENQKHLTRSEENNIEEVENTEGEPEKLGTGVINEDENVAQFRAHEDSIEDNKVTYDYKPHIGVYRARASDYRGDDRSKEQSPEDQTSKEKSPEDQTSKENTPEHQRSKEQSSEDRSSKEQSGEDTNFSQLKPVIREEGDKIYTYVRAPEYEDYHEKLAKWQKHHPVNPADFMK